MFLIRRWFLKKNVPTDTSRAAGSFDDNRSLSRFGAMPKLVDEAEFAELAKLPGFEARLLRKLRAERRRAFRLYLAELVSDFTLLANEALDRGANDPNMDPDFLEAVLKIKTRFTVSVFLLRASLWLPATALPKTHQLTLELVGSLRPLLSKSRESTGA